MGFDLPVFNRRRRFGSGYIPASLFAFGEQGAWYDPSDLATLFQDSAGTTPVTAAGQPVGRMLDKSGRGNHATQSTSASRPTYQVDSTGRAYLSFDGVDDGMVTPTIAPVATSDGQARRNLLIDPTQFDNATWSKVQATVTPNATTAPDGTTTADELLDTAVSNIHYTNQSISALSPSGKTYTISAYLKASTLGFATLGISDISSGSLYATAVFNLSTGAVSTSGAAGTGYSVSSTSISDAGSGWYRCVATVVAGTSATFLTAVVGVNKTGIISAGAGGFESYLGNGSGIFVWGAQLELGTTATAFQNVVGVDKVQVFAGVRKLSDTNTNILELSASIASNNGAIRLSTTAQYVFSSKGTVQAAATTTGTNTAPTTNVLTGLGNISGDSSIIRNNGVIQATTTTDQGTGNYLAYPIYIGSRNGASNFLNGRIYSLIVRFGANPTAEQIGAAEAWSNAKTGAY